MSFLLNGQKQGESFAVLTNTDQEKSLYISASAMDKDMNAKAGYYARNGRQVVRAEANIDGNEGQIYFDLNSAEGYRYTLGAIAGQYSAGFRGVYTENKGQKVCMSMYYGKTTAEEEPATACFGYDNIATAYFHKRAYAEVTLKKMEKSFEVTADMKQEG